MEVEPTTVALMHLHHDGLEEFRQRSFAKETNNNLILTMYTENLSNLNKNLILHSSNE